VIEIGSFSTLKTDLGKKRAAYERAGVKENWVVRNPYFVHIFVLNNDGVYVESVHRNEASIKVHSFEGLTIDLNYLQK